MKLAFRSPPTLDLGVTDAIPFLDLNTLHAPLQDELRAAFDRVLASGQFIMGPEVARFEDHAASYLGAGAHALGVSSGTDALLVALMALGVGPGDEVITTPFSFFATAGAVDRLGATTVFVDIEPDSFNLDPAKVAAAITPQTKAIIAVHLFGRAADMGGLREVARTPAGEAIPIIEDAAQAIGAADALGRKAGTLGTLGCFSFFPAKNLGAFGDGGLVSTTDAALAEKVAMLRLHGSKPKYTHHVVGGNFRLDALQAAILDVKLPHLDTWSAARRAHAARYDALLGDLAAVRTPPPGPGTHVYNQYVVRIEEGRDAVKVALAERGVPSVVYYPSPLHLQPCFDKLGYEKGDFPEAERACYEVLALPIGPTLGLERIERVATTLREVVATR